ncbi:MAG: RNA-binding S4 domain-containing protein [bacterium]
MRLDQFLKVCCLVKHRTEAKKACDLGVVKVNGQVAKASKEVRTGHIITVDSESRFLELEILAIPPGNVSKKDARELYRIIKDEHRKLFDF